MDDINSRISSRIACGPHDFSKQPIFDLPTLKYGTLLQWDQRQNWSREEIVTVLKKKERIISSNFRQNGSFVHNEICPTKLISLLHFHVSSEMERRNETRPSSLSDIYPHTGSLSRQDERRYYIFLLKVYGVKRLLLEILLPCRRDLTLIILLRYKFTREKESSWTDLRRLE